MAYPTTFVDLQNGVIGKLRLDTTNDLTRVKDTLNQVYAQVCIQTEANQQAGTATLTAGEGTYTMPAQVVRVKQITTQAVGQTGNSAPLRMVGLEEILERRRYATGASTGTVTHYALAGLNELHVWPTPSTADTLTFYYVYQPDPLQNDTDVPILQEPYASKILEYGALAELGDFLLGAADPSTQQYRQLYETWMQRFRAHLVRRAGGKTVQLAVVGGYPPYPHDPSADTGAL